MPGHPASHARLLLTESNPLGTPQITTSRELQAIVDTIKPTRLRDLFTSHYLLDLNRDGLIRTISEVRPTMLHFAGHGDTDGITVSDGNGGIKVLGQDDLAAILDGYELDVLFLNACYSAKAHAGLVKTARVFVGSPRAMKNSVAVNFASGFYGALAEGLRVEEAWRRAGLLAMPTGKADGYEILGDLEFSISKPLNGPKGEYTGTTFVDLFKKQSDDHRRSALMQLVGSCAAGATGALALYLGWPGNVLSVGVASLIGLPVAMVCALLMLYLAVFAVFAKDRASKLATVALIAEALAAVSDPPQELFDAFKASLKRAGE
jgi:hypothetical protein